MQKPDRHAPLASWLAYLEAIHPVAIDMGLARVDAVRQAMGLSPAFPVVLVGGTNGKGSVAAMVSTILRCAGYRVGTYTSPHILHYNERVAIDLAPASDATIVEGLAAVEAARGDVSLTYFEYGTLAAMKTFVDAKVDVAVLEVGLGGRLDATNVFDADVSAVVSVDIDHQAFLGDTREAIGFEKAGIYRAGRTAICADPNPPASLLAQIDKIGAHGMVLGRDYRYERLDGQWNFRAGERGRFALPLPALRGAYQLGNAACALAIIDALRERLPVDLGAVKRGLLEVSWPGRFQVLPGRPQVVLDVGHNPHAARALSQGLRQLPFASRRIAVFSMLADKDMQTVVDTLRDDFDAWYVAPLEGPRALSAEELSARLADSGVGGVRRFPDIASAWHAALSEAGDDGRICVFGSFHTVAAVMAARSEA